MYQGRSPALCLASSPPSPLETDPLLVSGHEDGTLRVWFWPMNPVFGASTALGGGDTFPPRSTGYSSCTSVVVEAWRGDPVVVSGHANGRVMVWRVDQEEGLVLLQNIPGAAPRRVHGVAVGHLGTDLGVAVVVGGREAALHRLSHGDPGPPTRVTCPGVSDLGCVALAPDCGLVVTGGQAEGDRAGGVCVVWSWGGTTPRVLHRLVGHAQPLSSLALHGHDLVR